MYAAAVNIDGSVDEVWKPEADGKVYALAVHGTDVYLGGAFTLINNLIRNHLAAVSLDGSVKTDWTPSANDDVLTIVSGTVTTTGVQPAPTLLFVGGDFTEINNVTRNHAAAIGVDGTLNDWDPNVNGRVSALLCMPVVSDCQTIFIGGNFTQVDSQPRTNLASWWLFVALSNHNQNLNGQVFSLATDSRNVYVGGDFTQFGESLRNHGAAFDYDSGDALLDWRPDPNDTVLSISVESKDKQLVYLGGNFTALRADLRPFAAAIRTDGSLSDTWAPRLGGLGGVDACFLSENTIFLGGRFTSINGVTRTGAAALDRAGALQDNFKPTISGGTIKSIAASGERIYLGGSFTQIDGVPRNQLASLYRINGGVVPDWDAQIEGSRVSALALSDSTLYVGGSFYQALGTPRLNAAAITTAGELLPWNPAFNDEVTALALDGSTVYAGGAFTSVDGLPRNSAAAVNFDGSISANWSPMCDSAVKTIGVSSSDIYLGGEFTHVNGENHTAIAAVGKDGALRSDWIPSLNQSVSCLSVGDSAIFVGGLFTKNEEIDSDYLALLDPVTGSNIPIPTPTPTPSPTPTLTPSPTPTPTPPPTPTFGPQPVLSRPVVSWSPRYSTSVVRAFVKRERGISYSISATSSAATRTGRCSIDRRTRKVLCTLDLSKGTWLVSVYPHKQGITGPPARRRFTFRR